MRLPINYIERLGRCTIKKVADYGHKYRVYVGTQRYKFATIHKAREFALNDWRENHAARL